MDLAPSFQSIRRGGSFQGRNYITKIAFLLFLIVSHVSKWSSLPAGIYSNLQEREYSPPLYHMRYDSQTIFNYCINREQSQMMEQWDVEVRLHIRGWEIDNRYSQEQCDVM